MIDLDESVQESELKVHFTVIGLYKKDFESQSIKNKFSDNLLERFWSIIARYGKRSFKS